MLVATGSPSDFKSGSDLLPGPARSSLGRLLDGEPPLGEGCAVDLRLALALSHFSAPETDEEVRGAWPGSSATETRAANGVGGSSWPTARRSPRQARASRQRATPSGRSKNSSAKWREHPFRRPRRTTSGEDDDARHGPRERARSAKVSR